MYFAAGKLHRLVDGCSLTWKSTRSRILRPTGNSRDDPAPRTMMASAPFQLTQLIPARNVERSIRARLNRTAKRPTSNDTELPWLQAT